MPKAVIHFLVCSFLLLGCAPRRPEASVAPGVDLAAYRRLAVMPFADRAGEGRAYAHAAGHALYEMGFDVAPYEAVESVLQDLDVRRGEPVGVPTLHELRRRTKASAVVYGTLDCVRDPKKRRVAVLFLDSQRGDSIFEMTYSPRLCGSDAGAAEAAQRLAARVKREVGDRLTGRTQGALP